MHTEKLRNILVEYSAYSVIRDYESLKGSPPGGLYFNKSMSLINSRLKDKGTDMKLPHCWYRWGDEVVKYYMPRELLWDNEETAYTRVKWIGNIPDFPEIKVKKEIDSIVSEISRRYSDYESLSQFIDLIYENAPFEFQRKYRHVREFFFHVRNSGLKMENPGRDLLLPQIAEAVEYIPEGKYFQEVKSFAPSFIKFAKYAVESGEYLSELEEISEEFWFWFSYFLRLHPDAHENVDSVTLSIWERKLITETDIFYSNFRNHVLNLSKKNTSVRDDLELRPYLLEAELEEREDQGIFIEFKDAVDDLEAFLQDSKDNFRARNFNN